MQIVDCRTRFVLELLDLCQAVERQSHIPLQRRRLRKIEDLLELRNFKINQIILTIKLRIMVNLLIYKLLNLSGNVGNAYSLLFELQLV